MDRTRRDGVSAGFILALTLAGAAVQAGEATFDVQRGGYAISSSFSIDPERHAIVLPPDAAQPGDLLRIRPRLNWDQYLVLQECLGPECSRARNLRAWNAGGVMGPLPVTSNKIALKPGTRYLLWLQQVSTKGGRAFPLYEEYSAPLVFQPAGSPALFRDSDLQAVRARGPSPVTRSSEKNGVFLAAFAGGAVVKLELLRPQLARSGP